MRARLLYRDAQGRDSGADLVIDGSFVGRAQECVVRTDDAMVSRRNCRIWREGKTWYVEDLVSSNGTFVNDQRIQKQALRHADVIRCGTLQARFVELDDLPSDRVDVDPSLMGDAGELAAVKAELESVLSDRSAKEQKLFDIGRELDTLRIKAETDSGELQRLRAETVSQREKVGELSRIRQLTDEELNAQVRVGEQLRRDLESLKADHGELRDKHDKTSGDLQARDRQLERSMEDVQRTKQTLDEVRARLGELERTKDQGWRELNNRAGELDGLRAVISEQERLLEERRVGLIALEASTHDLRQEKERLLREVVVSRNERDEAKGMLASLRTQLEGLDEEHRRLQRSVTENTGGSADESLKLATDLRAARVAQKTLEAERDRLTERAERADQARTAMEQKLASLDVERTHALEERQRAISAKERAEQQLLRAELQRKAAEEMRRGVEVTDVRLVAEVATLREELDVAHAALAAEKAAREKAEPHSVRYEQPTFDIPGGDPVTAPISLEEIDGQPNDARVQELEEELAELGAQLAIARAAQGSAGSAELVTQLRSRAGDAYNAVNDALSQLRTNILLARRLVGELGNESEAAESLRAAIAASIDNTEDAKGVLRSLREVAEA
ncbi:MAG: FHA domain-containing protein [Polyangia bacterium]